MLKFFLAVILSCSRRQLWLKKNLEVNSKNPWQELVFESPVSRISGITGGWSVDEKNYKRVGAEGHYGKSAVSLMPWNHSKFDDKYAFGALLVEIDGLGYIHVTGPMEFQEPVKNIRARINDGDCSLGDNGGSLHISFE